MVNKNLMRQFKCRVGLSTLVAGFDCMQLKIFRICRIRRVMGIIHHTTMRWVLGKIREAFRRDLISAIVQAGIEMLVVAIRYTWPNAHSLKLE